MMKVSARALSVPCPHCHRAISLSDLRIIGAHPGRALATCGDIQIEATARLQVIVIGRNVTVHGRVRGPVNGTESVEVGPTGHVIGDITSPKIVVHDGAIIQGRCQMTRPASIPIDPPVPDAPVRPDTGGTPVIPIPAADTAPETPTSRPVPIVRPQPLRRPHGNA
jgi:hypothetical protein